MKRNVEERKKTNQKVNYSRIVVRFEEEFFFGFHGFEFIIFFQLSFHGYFEWDYQLMIKKK